VKPFAPLLLAALALAGCGGGEDETAPASAPPATDRAGIVELENVLGLAADFRADEGKTRVLLLLSPT
jgi:hypothetical protein